MVVSIYFSFLSIGTFLLSGYLFSVGSTSANSIIGNLSASRLLLFLFFFLISCGFVLLAVLARKENSKVRIAIEKRLHNEAFLWFGFSASLIVAAGMLWLLTRQFNFFGNYKLIVERLEPVFAWLALLGFCTSFFMGLIYCILFVRYERGHEKPGLQDLNPLMAVFGILVAAKLIFVFTTSFGPTGRGDEMTYFDMAESFYRGFFSIQQTHHYPPLYPLTLVIALVFKPWLFEGIQVLNVIISSSIIFPAYFLARHFLDHKRALLAVMLVCLIPYHLVYPNRIVSENLYLPFFLWAVFTTFSLPASSKFIPVWHILNGVLIALSYLTRYITLAAIPFFCACWWIKPHEGETGFFKPGWKKIGFGIIFAASMLLAFSPWLMAAVRENLPLKLALGFSVTSKTNPEQLTMGNLINWVFLYGSYFILLAAPVFNFLLAALYHLDLKKWREGFNRFIIQTLAIMVGFFVAVVRHSWRARYNLEGPSAIMGRYLIVFLPLFLIIAMVCMTAMNRQNWKSRILFVIVTVVVPFVLVTCSYLVIIKGVVIPTDGNLLKSLGSIDGFYISALENVFFPLLISIYLVTSWLIWSDREKLKGYALLAWMTVFYLPGIPIYHFEILGYQTYPWLAKQIAGQLTQEYGKPNEPEQITVFMPEERGPKDGPEIYNGLRVRGYDNTNILSNTPESIQGMTTRYGFVLEKPEMCCEQEGGTGCYQINNQCFLINKVEKPVIP